MVKYSLEIKQSAQKELDALDDALFAFLVVSANRQRLRTLDHIVGQVTKRTQATKREVVGGAGDRDCGEAVNAGQIEDDSTYF